MVVPIGYFRSETVQFCFDLTIDIIRFGAFFQILHQYGCTDRHRKLTHEMVRNSARFDVLLARIGDDEILKILI